MGSWVLKRFGLNINIGHDYKLDSIFTEHYTDIIDLKKFSRILDAQFLKF